jgi:hypothetical protein
VIIAVPADTPDTIPVPPIEATVGNELFQIPPGVALDKTEANPIQMLGVPAIAAGEGLTDTTLVALQPVPIM